VVPIVAKIHSQEYIGPYMIHGRVSHGCIRLEDGNLVIETVPMFFQTRVCANGKVRMVRFEVNRAGISSPCIQPSNAFLRSSRLANSATKTIRSSLVLANGSECSYVDALEDSDNAQTQLAPVHYSNDATLCSYLHDVDQILITASPVIYVFVCKSKGNNRLPLPKTISQHLFAHHYFLQQVAGRACSRLL
jgi:hypothetical protein